MTDGEDVKFQKYAHDWYLGKNNYSALPHHTIDVLHQTTPMGRTITDFFAYRYRGLYKLVPPSDEE